VVLYRFIWVVLLAIVLSFKGRFLLPSYYLQSSPVLPVSASKRHPSNFLSPCTEWYEYSTYNRDKGSDTANPSITNSSKIHRRHTMIPCPDANQIKGKRMSTQEENPASKMRKRAITVEYRNSQRDARKKNHHLTTPNQPSISFEQP